MANKMIIDASHPEETRVVVLRGNRVEEFDFESASKRQLRGNIYLAKVTRVEPSLQAAFIEYGGNRHGFLAFSEIHPDYYQIPVADRLALLEEEARRHAEEEDEEPAQGQRRSRRSRDGRQGEAAKRRQDRGGAVSEAAPGEEDASVGAEAHDGALSLEAAQLRAADEAPDHGAGEHENTEHAQDRAQHDVQDADGEPGGEFGHIEEIAHDPAAGDDITTLGGDEHDGDEPDGEAAAHGREAETADEHHHSAGHGEHQTRGRRHEAPEDAEGDESDEAEEAPEQLGGGDGVEGDDERQPRRAARLRRHYKIQEVIKRRQVMLVQVVKEERGNKGAALTTYLSLAGRYSVLMPNTARGGGISRKITNNVDRKRLKEIAQELEVPDGMGIILRTAGAARSKPEVKRDFEYLLRMWEQVRELTLKSSAPMLTYEEGSLIKRAIRDLYSKEIDEVIVAGEAGYREAKDFMRMLMPGHSKNVIAYRDPQPIFARAGVEAQLDAMFAAQVTLKSGGYIVINQTEALVAIDVNSGRSTREHNIEDTALRTNLEAADEIARQLRLRDLAGLIVIDFIDMEEHRNNRSVERRIKDALRNDRARIQIGRISHFGLLEMSRQRIRTGVLEGSTVMCAHCMGAGTVRSTASIALHVLRVVEDALTRNAAYNINVRTRTTVALYILNQKRSHLRELERRFSVTVNVGADDMLTGVAYHAIERGEAATPIEETQALPASIADEPEIDDEIIDTAEELVAGGDEADDEVASEPDTDLRSEREPREAREPREPRSQDGEEDGDKGRKRRRRRRGGRGGDREATDIAANAPQPPDDGLGAISDIALRPVAAEPGERVAESAEDNGRPRNRRSRGGRGRNRREREGHEGAVDAVASAQNGEGNDGQMIDGEVNVGEAPIEAHMPEAAHAPLAAAAPVAAYEPPAAIQPARGGFWPPENAAAPAPEHDWVGAGAEARHVATTPAVDAALMEAPAAAPEKLAQVSTTLDPFAPKKSGWWKRAASSFGS